MERDNKSRHTRARGTPHTTFEPENYMGNFMQTIRRAHPHLSTNNKLQNQKSKKTQTVSRFNKLLSALFSSAYPFLIGFDPGYWRIHIKGCRKKTKLGGDCQCCNCGGCLTRASASNDSHLVNQLGPRRKFIERGRRRKKKSGGGVVGC